MKLFPRKNGSLRSKEFSVPKGGYAQLDGYDLCGVCVQIFQVHQDKCKCEYEEKPYCVLGKHVGIDENCTTAIIPMPGCYVAYVCEDDGSIEDAAVYLEVCKDGISNLQTVVSAAGAMR